MNITTIRRLTLASLLAAASLAPLSGGAAPKRVADFIAMQGVNVHLSQGTSNYKNMALVKANLAYLGIVNVRDSFNPFWDTAPYGYYTELARAGVKWNYIAAVGGSRSPTTIATFLANIAKVEAAVPGSTFAVEGPNEINNFPLTWAPTGQTGLDAALAFQKSLYAQTRASPLLKRAKVYYFTGYNAGGIPKGPDPTTTSGYADYNNQHPYPASGKPPARWLKRSVALGNTAAGNGPAVYTETGYQVPKTSAAQSAAWTLNILANSQINGIYRTYLYQLMDEGDGFGLFSKTKDNTPTATAVAWHNLNSILADTGATASSFTPSNQISYSVSGLPATGAQFALQKSNLETSVVIWAEPDAFPGPSTLVTVRFGSVVPSVQIFDPLEGTEPIQSLRNVSQVQVSVTDHPLIVQVPSPAVVARNKTAEGAAQPLPQTGSAAHAALQVAE